MALVGNKRTHREQSWSFRGERKGATMPPYLGIHTVGHDEQQVRRNPGPRAAPADGFGLAKYAVSQAPIGRGVTHGIVHTAASNPRRDSQARGRWSDEAHGAWVVVVHHVRPIATKKAARRASVSGEAGAVRPLVSNCSAAILCRKGASAAASTTTSWPRSRKPRASRAAWTSPPRHPRWVETIEIRSEDSTIGSSR